jgi:hypothetical protein
LLQTLAIDKPNWPASGSAGFRSRDTLDGSEVVTNQSGSSSEDIQFIVVPVRSQTAFVKSGHSQSADQDTPVSMAQETRGVTLIFHLH